MCYIRDSLLNGVLDLPSQQEFTNMLDEYNYNAANRMWNSLWSAYLKHKAPINLTYWAEQFTCPKVFNGVLISLCNLGWVESHSIPERNWAEALLVEHKLLNYVSPTELAHIRATKKIVKYLPVFKESKFSNLVKVNKKVKQTGLVREGFMLSGNTQYYFDSIKLKQYQSAVTHNVVKGMEKVRQKYPNMLTDEASYDSISAEIVQLIVDQPDIYTQGTSYLDSRGRAIKESLSKVANPIGFKDFRALLTIPK